MRYQPFFKLALTLAVSLAPLDAMAADAPAAAPAPQGKSDCEKKYEDNRNKLMAAMMGPKRPNLDMRDQKATTDFVNNTLCKQRQVIQGAQEVCASSFFKVRDAVIAAEDRSKEACALTNDAEAAKLACADGQAECLHGVSAKFRAAAAKIGQAKAILRDGLEKAKQLKAMNDIYSRRFALDLHQAANAFSAMKFRMSMDTPYQTAVANRMFTGSTYAEIAVQDAPMIMAEDKDETLKVLRATNADKYSSPEQLSAASDKIKSSISSRVDLGGGDTDLVQSGFQQPDQVILARTLTNRFATVAPKFEEELGASETKLNGYAAAVDNSAKGLNTATAPNPAGAPVSPAAPQPVAAAGGTPSPATAPSQAATSPTGGSAFSAASFPSSLSATGASRAVSYVKPSSASKAAAAAPEKSGLASPSSPAVMNQLPSDSPAAAVQADSADNAAVGTGGTNSVNVTLSSSPSSVPAFTERLTARVSGATAATTPPPAAGSAKISDSDTTLAAGRKALEDPQVKSIVDTEMARLGSRAPASASLRDRLRERLAASVATKLEAAKNEGAANGSMASLLNEARSRTDSDRDAYEKSFELGSAETDAEVARLMGKHDSEQLSDFPGALSKVSLFERVHSAHTRFQKIGAKKTEVLSRNP